MSTDFEGVKGDGKSYCSCLMVAVEVQHFGGRAISNMVQGHKNKMVITSCSRALVGISSCRTVSFLFRRESDGFVKMAEESIFCAS
jgi:hypothetical protein